jgi:outer membrane protein OmpA-like peptidoglycan-associated protein
MKRLFYALLILVTIGMSTSLSAQTSEYKNGITYKFLAHDYLAPISGKYFKVDDFTYGAEVGYHRFLNNSLNVGFPLRLSVLDFPVNDSVFSQDRLGASLDAVLTYKFNNGYILKEDFFLAPYVFAGLGGKYVDLVDQNWDAEVPVGLGLNIKLAKQFYLQLQTEYRVSLIQSKDNMAHSAGFLFLWGKGATDTDGDGITDEDDKCPSVPGVAAFQGCPDTDGDGITDADDACPAAAGTAALKGCPDADGDGIADKDDKCPQQSGLAKFNGCPDTDGDGITDADDKCPTTAGLAKFNGCPDTDGDGIVDADDKCPTEAGPASNQGCPVRDQDNDGIADADDKCPTQAGLLKFQGCPDSDNDDVADNEDRCPTVAGNKANKGCPDLKKEDQAILIEAMSAVEFETGSDKIKTESFKILDKVADVMKRNPAFHVSIEGHTDSQGDEAKNQDLSLRRALACYNYLVTKGIDSKRMTYSGYGESRPVADNNTSAGRAKNRRTEFNISVK